MAKKNALNVEFELSKPSVAIDVRYFQKSEGRNNERVSVSWKSRGPQPQWRVLSASERHVLLDLLLKLSRSAFPKSGERARSKNSAKRATTPSASAAQKSNSQVELAQLKRARTT